MGELINPLKDVSAAAGFPETDDGVTKYCKMLSYDPANVAKCLEEGKLRFIMNQLDTAAKADMIIAELETHEGGTNA